jgi:hypothetical protein
MHVVFKDEEGRIVEARLNVKMPDVADRLRLVKHAVRCDVYEDEGGVRGRLVRSYVREGIDGLWRPL